MNKAVFLDRDGTVIRDYGYLADTERVELLPDAGQALKLLADDGFKLVLVTNQSGIGRGFFSEIDVNAQHRRLAALLANFGVTIDAVEICPHSPQDGCECRKPGPAMLLRAARKLKINCANSFMIGDKPSDVEAGRRAGCRTILIGKANTDIEFADFHAQNLMEAVDCILNSRSQDKAAT